MSEGFEDKLKKIEEITWGEKMKFSDLIIQNSNDRLVSILIGLLSNESWEIRNFSALTLRGIKDNKAVTPLFKSVKRFLSQNNVSTMVYALEELDCSNHFQDVIDLIVYSKTDVQTYAIHIYMEQGFYVDDEDIILARKKLDKTNLKNEKPYLYERLNDFEQ